MFLSVRKCCPKCFFALTNVIINQIYGQIKSYLWCKQPKLFLFAFAKLQATGQKQ
jgi:hypothetical protein